MVIFVAIWIAISVGLAADPVWTFKTLRWYNRDFTTKELRRLRVSGAVFLAAGVYLLWAYLTKRW
jgi:hypothetical protein